jgi:hypothetical protein
VAKWTFENGMGTIMLQAGELPNPSRLAYLQELVSRVIKETVAMDLERRGLDPNVRELRPPIDPHRPGVGGWGLVCWSLKQINVPVGTAPWHSALQNLGNWLGLW